MAPRLPGVRTWLVDCHSLGNQFRMALQLQVDEYNNREVLPPHCAKIVLKLAQSDRHHCG